MIALDTSALFAALVPDQLSSRGGPDRELSLLEAVGRGVYELVSVHTAEIVRAAAVVKRYRDLGIGLTDASVVVLADRLGTNRIFTLDQRQFRAMQPLGGGHFELLPDDA